MGNFPPRKAKFRFPPRMFLNNSTQTGGKADRILNPQKHSFHGGWTHHLIKWYEAMGGGGRAPKRSANAVGISKLVQPMGNHMIWLLMPHCGLQRLIKKNGKNQAIK